MTAGSTASIALTHTLFAQGANQASVQLEDASGSPMADPTPADNSASVTTKISGGTRTTDIQVTGAAQAGGPSAGSSDT
jgi:hypothetical protein